MAAIVLLISSVAGPANSPNNSLNSLQAENSQTENALRAEESITEMVGVSPAPRAPKNFNISSLIFRF